MKIIVKKIYIKKKKLNKIYLIKHKNLLFFISFIIYCILILLSFNIEKTKKISVCLCVIGRKENLYVKEYINHYKALGYNHIFIYDNNFLNETKEKFVDILKEEMDNGFVSIINFFNFRGKKNNAQYEAYYDCYKKNNRNYDWLSFFDFDEFLELNPKNQTIQAFLSNKRYKNCQSIKINWLIYESDKELLYYENKSLSIRFNKPIYDNNGNKLIKTTVRGKLTNYWKRWETPHSCKNRYNSCNSSGKKVIPKEVIVDPPDYKYAYIKHYYKKSFEEYCLKIKRGWPDEADKIYAKNILIYENKNNSEKLNIIKKIFNISRS